MYINVPSKNNNKQKTYFFNLFFVAILKATEEQDPDPEQDPLVRKCTFKK
jgi:hypothetical protein